MDIEYRDEYDMILFQDFDITVVPAIGSTVVQGGDEYRVKDVKWFLNDNLVVIELTQNSIKASIQENDESGRLKQLNNAILAVSKRQDVNEKKIRSVTEQISTVRKHINRQIQQDKKDKNDIR